MAGKRKNPAGNKQVSFSVSAETEQSFRGICILHGKKPAEVMDRLMKSYIVRFGQSRKKRPTK